MKKLVWTGLVAMLCGVAEAQAPAAAPAGANGICKDGTYSTAASKSGACGGHKGLQTWYGAVPAKAAPAAAAAAPAAVAAPTAAAKPSAAMPAPTPAPAAGRTASAKVGPAAAAAGKTAAAGGGPGLVWVNTESNVYHCYGDTFYGKTKAGSYMAEADAKGKGAHGAHGKSCSK